MKKNLRSIIALLFGLLIQIGYAQTQFWQDNFEDSGAPSSGTRTPSVNNSTGGPPATRYFMKASTSTISTVTAYSNVEGSSFWAGEDHRLSPITQSAHQNITWMGINIYGKSGLSFKGMFASGPANFDLLVNSVATDYVIVEYRIDGGQWTSGLRFFPYVNGNSSTYLSLETTGDSTGEGVTLLNSSNFTEFTFNIAKTGTTLDLRLKAHSNSLSEEWAIDNFRLLSTPVCTITASTSQTNVSCNGGTTGSASVVASGGTPGYTYLWSNAKATPSITGLTAGSYTCTITDANACSITKSFTIIQPSVITASTSQTNVSCNGGTTGSASVVASGGTPAYTYLWSNAKATPSITGLTAGAYTCTITDANACSITKSFTIIQPSAITASTSQTNVSCNGGTTGSASVVASGGTSPYSYAWSNGSTASSVSGLTAGSYTCTITDANACSITKSFTIIQPIAITASITRTICKGDSVRIGSSVYKSAGKYTTTLAAKNGCDSVVTLNLTVNIGTVWYLDSDGDGFGNSDSSIVSCVKPVGYSDVGGDNCIKISNPTQADSNSDGIGDACILTDLEDISTGSNKLYPIPSTGIVIMEMEFVNKPFVVINGIGEVVKKGVVSSKMHYLDLTNYPEGVYILQVEGKNFKMLKY